MRKQIIPGDVVVIQCATTWGFSERLATVKAIIYAGDVPMLSGAVLQAKAGRFVAVVEPHWRAAYLDTGKPALLAYYASELELL